MALSLGAIHKVTGSYVYPRIAKKKEQYICPECNKDLVLVKGEVRIPHFRHKADDNPCHYHSRPSESQMHKDAKMLMKTLLANKTSIRFIRNCSCKKNTEINLPEVTHGSSIVLEYRFEHEGGLRIADVAHIHDGNIMSIYEICHTHKTCSEKRPDPWVEIDAFSLLTSVNKNEPIILKCIRRQPCKDCYMKQLKYTDLEKYVRIKLGQNIEHPSYDEYGKVIHDRLKFNATSHNDDENYEDNKKIADIFEVDLAPYKAVFYCTKGSIKAYLVNKKDYKEYYWNKKYRESGFDETLELPYRFKKDYSGTGTVDIIISLIEMSDYCSTIWQDIYDRVS
jgi:hypothetical protein